MLTKRHFLLLGLLLVGGILSLLISLPKTTTIRGKVLAGAIPIGGAVVRWRGHSQFAVTDSQGNFALTVPSSDSDLHLTAWAPGYYVTGSEAVRHDEHVTLTLTSHPTEDNPAYQFIHPTRDMENPTACGHCHRDRTGKISMPVDEWQQDAHAASAANPRFLSLYNGTTLDGKQGAATLYTFDPELGIDVPAPRPAGADVGFRLDFPDQAGSCALCHAPILALDSPYNADPNQARESITCDFCHKIWNVRLGADGLPSPNLPGVLSLEFLRPPAGQQVFIGPFDDTPGDDIYSPLQSRSEICAACHFAAFWGVSMYNSFGEWLASPYSDPQTGRTCQDCHMPHTGAAVFAQLPPDNAHYVPQRDPAAIFSHLMPGTKDRTLLENTAALTIDAQRASDSIVVRVRVTNSGAGHHIPTDNPLRNMILLLTATDSAGHKLAQLEGARIPAWGGVGDPQDGYYAGEAGVLYAKILADFYTGETPTYAYWRQTRLVSDNRIAVLETDETTYKFALPPDGGAVTVDARLFLRRAFIELMVLKGWDTPDMLMAHEVVQVE